MSRFTQAETIAFLKEVPLFAGLCEAELAELAAEFRSRRYRKGDTIFHQWDQSRTLYIVRQGKVRIFHLNAGGEETTVNILVRWQVIGEFAMIDEQPRSATARAISACELLEIGRAQLWRYLENSPGLALALCRQVVAKARWTSAYAETMAQLDAAGRLLQLLLHYNEDFGREDEAGRRYTLDLGLNQSDLATLVGASRGWVNHILQEWRQRDLVDFDGGQVTILDLPGVEAERDSRMAG